MEMKNTPKLRFPGFTEPWELRKLGEIADIIGGGTPSTSFADYWDGDIDWYSPAEIGSNRYVSDSIRKITKLGLEKSSTKILPVGTVLFTSRAGIGNTAILRKEGCTNQGFQSIIPRKNILDTYFLYTLTPQLKRYGELMGAGSTFVEVSGRQMEKMPLNIPSLEEQKKIGKLFEFLDDSIILHQRKLEHLKLKKKSLLQKLFPKEGEVYPELRFPGFTDPWEQCKLGNLGTLKNGMNFSKEAMGKGYPFINLQNIFGSNVIDLTKLEKAEATDSQLKDYNLQKGDVLFVRSSVKLEGVGEAALISEDLKDTTYSGFIIRFRDNYGLDYNFKRFIFTTVLIRNQIMSQATNSANKNISQSVLNNLNLLIPTKDEQSKIGLIFSKLDKCITLHQRKLEHLKLLKKALLQLLFV